MVKHSVLTHVLPFSARRAAAPTQRANAAPPRASRGLGVRRGPHARLGFGLALLVCAVGCDGSGGKKLGIADGASAGASTTALVTADDEVTMELETGARLKFPQGSVDGDLEVTFKRPADSEASALVKSVEARQKIASAPYVITPHGAQFKREVEVVLPVEKNRDASRIKVAWLEDEKDTEWKVISTPQIADGKATFRVTHFSVFVLLESQPTSSGPQPGGGSDLSSRFVQKLDTCGLLSKTGDFTPIVAYTPEDECYFDCLLNASCEALQTLWCSDAADPSQIESCESECEGGSFTCADGESIPALYRCDLSEDCVDGSDEVDCPEGLFFTCDDGLTTLYGDEVCDTYTDCSDGTDEADCEGKYFECADGSGVVPLGYVCDFEPDCLDGSDEPARCAQLSCEL